MESVRDTEEFQKVLHETSMIKKGEVVLEHLSENKLSAYLEYHTQMIQLEAEQKRIKNAIFEMLEAEIPEKDINTGVRDNGETLVLVKIPKPENPTNILGSILSGCFQNK